MVKGAAEMELQFEEKNVLVWKVYFDNYQKVFECFCDKNPKKKNLRKLDAW